MVGALFPFGRAVGPSYGREGIRESRVATPKDGQIKARQRGWAG